MSKQGRDFGDYALLCAAVLAAVCGLVLGLGLLYEHNRDDGETCWADPDGRRLLDFDFHTFSNGRPVRCGYLPPRPGSVLPHVLGEEDRAVYSDILCYPMKKIPVSTSPAPEPTMFYFGCHRDAGHYLWTEDKDRLSITRLLSEQPWGYGVDGDLCPPKGFAYGQAMLTHRYAWSALSWWDNSIDTRPGSHSTFLAVGTHSASALLAMARARFPWVFARFKYEVVLDGEDK